MLIYLSIFKICVLPPHQNVSDLLIYGDCAILPYYICGLVLQDLHPRKKPSCLKRKKNELNFESWISQIIA